jgi:hypothetical protein
MRRSGGDHLMVVSFFERLRRRQHQRGYREGATARLVREQKYSELLDMHPIPPESVALGRAVRCKGFRSKS